MSCDLHASPFFHYSALSVNHKRAALDAAHRLAIHLFHLHDIELQADGFVRIGNQFERQVQLGLEAFVRTQRIAADAVDFHIGGGKFGIRVTKRDIFGGAAWRVVFRIKEQHAGPGGTAQQLKRFAAGHGGSKIGYGNEG